MKVSGTNKILDYDWKANKWYKMVIHCWDDKETGNTFVGQWVQNVETGDWELISYFNTNLKKSYILAGFNQFIENYLPGNAEKIRDINLKNMYARSYDDNSWISLNKMTLSYNKGANATGRHEFGANDEYFYGLVGGTVEDQEKYENESERSGVYEINQPSTPDLGKIKLSNTVVNKSENTYEINWNYEDDSTPQLGYKISIIDDSGNIIKMEEETRPEVQSYKYTGDIKENYKAKLTVTDILGNEDTVTIDLYKEGQNISNPKPENNQDTDNGNEDTYKTDKENNGTETKKDSINDTKDKDNTTTKDIIPKTGETLSILGIIGINILIVILTRKFYKKVK